MVNREQFEEICNKYGLDSKKLIKNNENVLEKTDYNSICYVLDFLRDTLKVSPNNIEKCPSIFYFRVDTIEENWNFLNEKKINTRDVETCLHILSTEPEQLKKTYEYVSAENRYGKKYIEQITTILRVSVERIQEIEEKCPELTRENILSAAISRKGVDEIKEIVRVCQKNEVKVTDGVFRRSATEIREIIRICQENGIEIIGSVFRRTATEVEEIVEICKKNGIKITGCIFLRRTSEIKEIVKVCKDNGIEVIGSVFYKTADEIKEIVKVCQENGIEITGSVFLRTAEEIKEIVEICQKNGIKVIGTVFYKTADEIKKIIEVCQENEIEVTRSVFYRTAEEVKEIVEICQENEIEVTGTVFLKRAFEIKEIVKVCKDNEIEVTGSVFRRTATGIKEIVKVCKENGIEVTGSVFTKNSKQLKENIEYIKQNYGEEYLTTLIVSKNLKHLQKTLPYLQSIGVLETIKTSASILSLTLEEIKERQVFIESIGEPIVKGNKFNPIFGMIQKRYQKNVKEYEEKKKLIGEIKGAIQEGQELDEQINSKEQSQK